MKQFISAGCFLLFFIISVGFSDTAYANKKYASLVMDADTGMILHQRNADKMLHPASLTKVMTLLMLFEAIDNRQIGLNDRILISRKAASMVPSKIGLPAGSSIRVKDAIYALVTKSANDIAVAVAERLGKTESRFAVMMTKKARSFGMNRTRFMNASGLHHPKQVTTARDMAKMGRYLIALQPKHYRYFSTQRFTYRGKKYKNHNKLLGEYNGMDGIKTGYIQASGFNLLASAKRGNKRLIGVVFGGKTSKSRNAHMREILDDGFRKVRTVRVAAPMLPTRNPKRVALASKAVQPKIIQTSQLTNNLLAANTNNQTAYFNRLDRYKNNRLEVIKIVAQKHSELISQQKKNANNKTTATSKTLQAKPAGSFQLHGIQKASLTNQSTNYQHDKWGIQIGAYSDRNLTGDILEEAHKKLPLPLQHAEKKIVPLESKKGLIYRAWLTGFTQSDAKAACLYYKECMVIEPQT